MNESSALYILRLSAHIGEMEFDVVGSNGGVLFDTFVTDSAIYSLKNERGKYLRRRLFTQLLLESLEILFLKQTQI